MSIFLIIFLSSCLKLKTTIPKDKSLVEALVAAGLMLKTARCSGEFEYKKGSIKVSLTTAERKTESESHTEKSNKSIEDKKEEEVIESK